jgi:hypothetical protein
MAAELGQTNFFAVIAFENDHVVPFVCGLGWWFG